MNPDPVAKLTKFTPASSVDPSELLFAAGRASARTFWGWKFAVAALLVSNAVCVAFLAFGRRDASSAVPPAEAAPVVQPNAAPPLPPEPQPPTSAVDAPWSYHTLRTTDLERMPKPQPVANLVPPREPLTALSGRSGEID